MMTPTMNRRFGVEIEFLPTITKEQALTSLRDAGINVEFEGYTHRTTPHWKIVTDGSCGYELVSPVLEGEAGVAEVHRAATALEAAGAEVDKKCGLHVHFDASAMNMKSVRNLFKLWLKFEDVLDTFQPTSRRGNDNTYCQSNLKAQVTAPGLHALRCQYLFDKIDACKDMDKLRKLYPCRYRKLNVQSYFRHRTLEVRHHAGTVDATKITNWIA